MKRKETGATAGRKSRQSQSLALQPRPPASRNVSAPRPGTRQHQQRKAKQELALLNALAESDLEQLIHLSDDDLETAFEFLDDYHTGELTLYSMRERLAVFYESADKVPLKDLKLLVGEHKTLRLADMRKILNETTELLQGTRVNPIKEVFRLYDPTGTGFMDSLALRSILQRMGHRNITDEDINVLIETLDSDGDGKIGLDDFRKMLKLDNSACSGVLVKSGNPQPELIGEGDVKEPAAATEIDERTFLTA